MRGLKSLLLLTLFLCTGGGGLARGSILGDLACTMVGCGRGTCNGLADDNPPFFFDCECDPGWTQVKMGNLTFPPCLLPNCTLDFSCGSLPPPLSLSTIITDPCSLIWCGDGTCKIPSGGGIPTCACNHGSFNLLNSTGLPCLKQCNLGMDCQDLELGPPPPPPQLLAIPSSSPRAKGDGCCTDTKNDGGWIGGALATSVLSMSLQLLI